MGKSVWLVSHYAMPPHLEVRIKTIRYAQILQSRGYEVTLITASTIHNTDINLIEGKELYIQKEYEGLNYIHIRCSKYKGNGLKRIKNLMQFQRRFNKVMKRFKKPDIIVADCNCINYKGILKFAKKRKIPFVSEIRDLWPLSMVEYMNISESNPVITYLYHHEKRMYKLSDAIIFSMAGGKDYIKEKGWDKRVNLDKVFNINNGIDLNGQEREIVSYDNELFNDDSFKVVYAGSIRAANNIGLIVDAAEKVLQQTDKIKFLIFGDGDSRADLEKSSKERNITNVHFCGKVNKKYIPYILSQCDLAILTYQNVRTWKYGGSQNKLFDYLYAGIPVITNIKMGYSVIEEGQCGIEIGADDPELMAKGILDIYNMPKDKYKAMCSSAKEIVKQFDFEKLTDKLEEVIEYACNNKEK